MTQEDTNLEQSVHLGLDASKEINELIPALLKAQKKMGSAKKDSDNPFFKSKYANFNSVLEACKDQLNDAGIAILQPTSVVGEQTHVSTVLVHESGQWIKATMIALEARDMQKSGSSVSYARRYTLQSLVAIPTSDDDDGEGAVGRGKASSKKKEEPKETKSSSSSRRSGFGGMRKG